MGAGTRTGTGVLSVTKVIGHIYGHVSLYVGIFPLPFVHLLHISLAVTTILVSVLPLSCQRTKWLKTIGLGLVFVAHELPSVSNFMLILWGVQIGLLSLTVLWPDAQLPAAVAMLLPLPVTGH